MAKRELEDMILDFVCYLRPDIASEKYVTKNLILKSPNEKQIKKYHSLLGLVEWILKKRIARYELYFLEFYPKNRNIKKFEALEYHVESYLEDITTLKNYLNRYINLLKADLTSNLEKVNKEKLIKSLDSINTTIDKALLKVSKPRGDHRHGTARFLDKNITFGSVCEDLLGDDSVTKNMISSDGRVVLKNEEEKNFKIAQEAWVSSAKKNTIQLNGLVDDILRKTKPSLYRYLRIDTVIVNQDKP